MFESLFGYFTVFHFSNQSNFLILPPTSSPSFINQSAVTNTTATISTLDRPSASRQQFITSRGAQNSPRHSHECSALSSGLCAQHLPRCPCPLGSFHRRRCSNLEITKRKIWLLMFFPYHFLAALYLLLKCMVNENIKCFTDFLT